MTIPAIRALRKIFPSAQIALWGPAGLEPLLRVTGIPDEAITFESNSVGTLKRPFLMREKLRAGCFDMAILFQNAFESAFTAWLARIPLRAGYPTDLRGPLLTMKVPLTDEIRRKHQVFYYLAITDYLRGLFSDEPPEAIERPDCSVTLDETSLGSARELLASAGVNQDAPLFCLCPGSVNSEAKRWPAESFSRLADLIVEQMAAQVVFLGAPQEQSLIQGILAGMRKGRAASLAGRGDMIGSMAVMSLSQLVVSNDTGSAHLAVAAGARVLTVFGPTSAGATAPYGPTAHILQGIAPCAPCRHFRCPVSGHPCMESITPEAVMEKMREIVAGDANLQIRAM
jgi:heptosyltransferase II